MTATLRISSCKQRGACVRERAKGKISRALLLGRTRRQRKRRQFKSHGTHLRVLPSTSFDVHSHVESRRSAVEGSRLHERLEKVRQFVPGWTMGGERNVQGPSAQTYALHTLWLSSAVLPQSPLCPSCAQTLPSPGIDHKVIQNCT
jgi:hypothetical protein